MLLVLAAILGVPISAAAYGFLALASYLQKEIFTHLPHRLGFSAEPVWWPLPALAVGGVLAGLAIRYLPERGGPSPAGGFAVHGAPTPAQLPGVICAALATLVFGAVLGPEMPLIAIGGRLAVLAIRAARCPPRGSGCWLAPGASRPSPRCWDRPSQAHSRCWRRPGWAARCRAGAAAGPAGGGNRLAHLHRPGQPDRAGHVLAGPSRPSRFQPAHRGRVRLGGGDRTGRRPGRFRDRVAGTLPADLCRQMDHARRAAGGRRSRCARDHLRGGDRQATSDVLFSGHNALDPLITSAASYSGLPTACR